MSTELEALKSTKELDSEHDFRAAKAHEKRLGGFSWELVAQEYGYTNSEDARQSVKAYIQRCAMRVGERTRKESLDRELDRLDILQSACWEQALQGDLKAIETSLKIIGQRSKLMGLEQLQEGNVTHQTIVVRGTKEEFVDQLKQITRGQ